MLMFLLSAEAIASGAQETLEELILRLGDGDAEAMGPLYDMTRTSVYAYALSLLKNSAEAEDAMHDSFIAVWSGAKNYKPHGKPTAWIMTVVRNQCMSRLRALRRETKVSEEKWEDLLRVEEIPTNLHIAEALDALDDTERQIVLLHAVSGMKHRETAELLGLKLATVLSKHSRALKKLRRYLSEGEGV